MGSEKSNNLPLFLKIALTIFIIGIALFGAWCNYQYQKMIVRDAIKESQKP